jgi:hypothetical protein
MAAELYAISVLSIRSIVVGLVQRAEVISKRKEEGVEVQFLFIFHILSAFWIRLTTIYVSVSQYSQCIQNVPGG